MGKSMGRFAYDSATAQQVAAGGNIAYRSATVEGGCIADAGGGVIRIKRPGIYRVAVNATLEATAAGAVGLRLKHNGENVVGAFGAATLAAMGDLADVSFQTLVTVGCCANDALAVVADAATSVTVAAVVVEKVG